MRIEIICTGDEVLTGKIVNTNFYESKARRRWPVCAMGDHCRGSPSGSGRRFNSLASGLTR